MRRCLELAEKGAGFVAPNPLVGAVLVYNDRIIGEGYHQKYGEAHAEVNAIHQAALSGQVDKISQSTLYVSLEPCVHFGKTPPCSDLIIEKRIPKVVIGCRDPFKEVNGKGIEKLKATGIEVETGILEKECKDLNKRFFTFHTQHRPYIILKWAQTADGKMAASPPPEGGIYDDSTITRLLISNDLTNRLVHKWRSEEASILVGTNTAMLDDPALTTRLWEGPSPVRLVVDMDLRLPSSLKIFNAEARTIIFNTKKHSEESDKTGIKYYRVTEDTSLVYQVVNALYPLKIQSVLVEGGAKLLQSFIDEGMWDEIRTISNKQLTIGKGLAAPVFNNNTMIKEMNMQNDTIEIYKNERSIIA